MTLTDSYILKFFSLLYHAKKNSEFKIQFKLKEQKVMMHLIAAKVTTTF